MEIGSPFLALTILTFLMGYLCIKSDPTDLTVLAEQSEKQP